MSRFKILKKYLSLTDAVQIYLKIKLNRLDKISLPNIKHSFSIRNNPFDLATLEEVLLQKTYRVPNNIQPKYIIDAGGNIGLTAIYFANLFPEAQIITIEPDSDNFQVLQKNVHPYKNIQAINKGVWFKPAYLKVVDTGIGNNGFTVKEVLEKESFDVEAISLEEILKQFNWPYIDILKIDIEGSEKELFENNANVWLPKTKILFVELHDRMKEGCSQSVFKAITQFNFSCEIVGENLLFINNDLI